MRGRASQAGPEMFEAEECCVSRHERETDSPDYSFEGPVKLREAHFLKEMRFFFSLKPPGNSSISVCYAYVCVGIGVCERNRKMGKTLTDGEAEGENKCDLGYVTSVVFIHLVR